MRRIESLLAVTTLTALMAWNVPAFAQQITITTTKADGTESKRVLESPKRSKRNSQPQEPPGPPKIEEPTFTAQGGFLPTKEKARESALLAATDAYAEYLKEQGIDRKPTTSMVRKLIIRHKDAPSDNYQENDKIVEETIDVGGSSEKLYRVEVAVKVKPDDVRRMRALERSAEALWILAGLGALAGVGAVFFRVDAWTKGYLTSWLVLGTVGAAGLLAGLWWWAR